MDYDLHNTSIMNLIKTENKIDLPNIVISNPDLAAKINDYGMNLELNESYNNLYIKNVLNSNIIGDNKKLLSLPFATSTQIMGVNKPLLNYIIISLIENGAIIEGERAIIDEILAINLSNDLRKIEDYWIKKQNASTFIINDEIFLDFNRLISFVNEISNNFEYNTSISAIGFDSIEKILQLFSNALEEKNFLNNSDQSYLDYSFISEGTINNELFKKSFDKFMELAKSRFSWVSDGTKYGSTKLVNHKQIFTIGSSTGAQYFYSRDENGNSNYESELLNSSEVLFMNIPSINNKNLFILTGPNLIPIHVNSAENNATLNFLNWLMGNNEYKFENNEFYTPSEYFSIKSSYITPLNSIFSNDSTVKSHIDKIDLSNIDFTNEGQYIGSKMVFENIENNKEIINNYWDRYSSYVYSDFKANFSSLINKLNRDKIVPNYNEFINEIKNFYVRNNLI